MAIDDDVLFRLPALALAEISAEVRDGDILLCAAHDPFSRLIGWSTKSPWSHVALAYRWAALDRIVAFECVQQIGVHAVSLERFISQTSSGAKPYPGKIVLARHGGLAGRMKDAEAKVIRRMTDFAVDRMGDRFSPFEVLKIATRIAVGRFNRHMPRMLGAKDEYICSEYVAKCFQRIGIQIAWDGLGFIAPADIARDPQVTAVARFRTR
ncbi:MAG TPA: hypothetical protein VFC47_12220 [Caulobacteraceae bacterium]|nr:hypothetical protein [Caulobacteraceae bacterium]